MTILNHFALQPGPNGPTLGGQAFMQQGPITPVEVTVPAELMDFFNKAGQSLPPPCSGVALIDTGAGRTCIDVSVVEQLNLNPISAVQVITASGLALQGTYAAKIRLPVMKMDIDFSSVLSVNLAGQKIQGMPVIVLIGRDLLANCVFIYNGQVGNFILAN